MEALAGMAGRDYVPLILEMMAEKSSAQRALAQRTGISKTRLALLLHRDPAKRSRMTLNEFERILNALGTDIVRALLREEIFRDLEALHRERYEGVAELICEFMFGLGRRLIDALEEIGGIDGSEVRKEWASILQGGFTKQVTNAVSDVVRRRSLIAERDDLWR
ncbi:helix-turn-helix domain-containing protein [Sphingobium algorifonticola]|nr:helix-turn-helix transcriptional regulator [Sphingobium algorifonticola]